jgi:hypothetical protein
MNKTESTQTEITNDEINQLTQLRAAGLIE